MQTGKGEEVVGLQCTRKLLHTLTTYCRQSFMSSSRVQELLMLLNDRQSYVHSAQTACIASLVHGKDNKACQSSISAACLICRTAYDVQQSLCMSVQADKSVSPRINGQYSAREHSLARRCYSSCYDFVYLSHGETQGYTYRGGLVIEPSCNGHLHSATARD